ncbi:alkaline phosphatase [Staphylococcus saprophyticus]|nr:alkaline phosphatase [Staphylococcus saprophyticus]
MVGLFGDNDMGLEIDARKENAKVVDMRDSGVNKLKENDKGLLLMVEGA